MDPIRNPYSPNAGAPPPAMVGRDDLLETFDINLSRIKIGRSAKSLLPTGLRGVGKTVLLNRAVEAARSKGYQVAQLEASEAGDFVSLLASQLRSVLFGMSGRARVAQGINIALRALKSFALTFKLSDQSVTIGVDPERGVADSGILSTDLIDLFVKLGEAAKEEQTAILIAIDEVQYLKRDQLEAIIMAVHRVTQLMLPIMIVGAGLPQLPALAGNAKSYAERLFAYPNIGPLLKEQAFEAIRKPARDENADFNDDALQRIYDITKGYPYFIQEWAYHAWNHAESSQIRRHDIDSVQEVVLARLDESFFRVRFDRLTPREKEYLRAMAELGPGPQRSGDIAALLGMRVESMGPLRSGLIKKGMIYSPQHGDNSFTVPLFDDFMKRTMPTS
jgi:hypothetical protein